VESTSTTSARSRRLRIAIGLFAAPLAMVLASAALYYGNVHRNAAAMSTTGLAPLRGPAPGDRVMVVAPHCDDETLGVGGLIATARERGVPVTVAFLTNGDGFRIAATVALKEVAPRPSDYLKFGEMRRAEAIRAVGALGVPESAVRFLGYPDQGLKAIWESTGASGEAVRSRFTGANEVPFSDAITPGAPYLASSVVADLVRVMEQERPTDVYVTHPADDHGDHCAAAAFTEAACHVMSARAGTPRPRVHHYLLHRGDWPLPQGDHPEHSLLPPEAMVDRSGPWETLVLSDTARLAKRRALSAYRTQMEVMPRLLTSFLRRNEVFVDAHGCSVSRDRACVSQEPLADDLSRFANPSADIAGVEISVDGDALKATARLRSAAAPGVRYRFRFRALGDPIDMVPVALRTRTIPMGTPSSSSVSVRIPFADLGLPESRGHVMVDLETDLPAGIVVDRTGYRTYAFGATDQ